MNKCLSLAIIFLFGMSMVLVSSSTVKASSSSSVNSDWSFFRGDAQRTGYSVNTTNIPTIEWSYSVDYPVVSSPAIANGLVYIKGEHMLCINASTGAEVWESSVASSQQFSSPIVADDYVFVCSDLEGTYGGEVYALNASTGDTIWTFPANASTSTPAFMNGVVYVGSESNEMYAINAYTGQEIWSYQTNGAVHSSPVVQNDLIYFGSNDGNVYALNATTGDKVWNYTTGIVWLSNPFGSSPAVSDGILVIGSNNNGVYALNAITGAKIWNFSTKPSGDVICTPAIANGNVYLVTYPYVYALNLTTGDKTWAFKTFLNGSGFLSTDNEVSSATVANDIVYVNSADGNTYALNAYNGNKIGNFTVTQPNIDFYFRYSSPAVWGNTIYVGIDETLYAIHSGSFTATQVPSDSLYSYGLVVLLVTAIAIILLLYRRQRKTAKLNQ